MNAVRVPWSSASFLAYLGGLTILGAILSLLGVQSSEHGAFGFVFWSLFIFAVLAGFAYAARSFGHFVIAGLLSVSTVVAFVVFLGAVLDWFGWLADINEPTFEGFHVSLLFLELSLVVAAAVALRIFQFPLLVFLVAGGAWFFTTDFLSGGGDWSAILTIVIGFILLLAGIAVDDGSSRPFGFWLHVVAGLTLGGGLIWFFHDSGFDWIVIALIGLLYITLGDRLGRSSWVVLGAWGILQTTSYFADKWSEISLGFFPVFYLFPFVALSGFDGGFEERNAHEWAGPLAFAVAGIAFIWIGLWLARRRREAIPGAELL